MLCSRIRFQIVPHRLLLFLFKLISHHLLLSLQIDTLLLPLIGKLLTLFLQLLLIPLNLFPELLRLLLHHPGGLKLILIYLILSFGYLFEVTLYFQSALLLLLSHNTLSFLPKNTHFFLYSFCYTVINYFLHALSQIKW